MNRLTKIIIIIFLILSVAGIWGFKTYNSKKSSINSTNTSQQNMPMLVDLGAGTCIPCKQMVPVLEEVKKMYDGKATVKVIDVYDSPDEANKYKISVIPTQIFLDKDGKEVFRHEGFFPKEEIVKVFDKMGVK